jgi:general L-amino acid transport system permease protein
MSERTTLGQPTASLPPPANTFGPVAWLRGNLFNTWYNALLTLLVAWALLQIVPGLYEWAVGRAHGFESTADACRADLDGACWGFVAEKARFILFGTFPYDEQWRPFATLLVLFSVLGTTAIRRFWKPWLFLVWVGGLTLAGILMWGGVFGLTPVENDLWGGLPLTFILAVFGLGVAFPLSILLALGRRSSMSGVRGLCVAYIELIRGVPLISLLFMASVMLPLFLPNGVSIDKLLRAQVAFILFAAAYMAEAIRGGLQSIPRGQYEAADSLGLGYWLKMRKVILPQALAISIPPLVNTFNAFFMDTSLVIIVGLYDLLGTAKTSLSDSVWRGFYKEAYLTVGLIYWVFCFLMSKYSRSLERQLNRSNRR